ncbi:MAG TPA: YsnF/AvaK domain-containing protein [Clostridium sp.]|uniref:YsnF/AvaK domain-containing protein n=1 Tax=Clostridium sp. TaxID=1506 RepID=UPI002F926BAA
MTTFQIKKEELEIAKKWMKTGEVNIYRETITEEKTFTVPFIREELVINKKALKYMPTEVIRILLNEEHVDFYKHKVNFEEVSIYKQQIQDIKHIEETLMREEPILEISDSLENTHISK